MVTTNIIQRTFQIRYAGATGACFTIDVDNRQYLITARHCVSSLMSEDVIEVFHDKTWKRVSVKLVGHGADEVDISVMAPQQQLSPTHPLPASMAEVILGQDVYFLGFPFGLTSDSMNLNGGFPFPLVKKATLSAIDFGPSSYLLLDGINNKGFSGGAVVYFKSGSMSWDYSVAGVISSYKVFNNVVHSDRNPTSFHVQENTGIIVAYSINHATQLIDSNPIGFKIET